MHSTSSGPVGLSDRAALLWRSGCESGDESVQLLGQNERDPHVGAGHTVRAGDIE